MEVLQPELPHGAPLCRFDDNPHLVVRDDHSVVDDSVNDNGHSIGNEVIIMIDNMLIDDSCIDNCLNVLAMR